MIFFYLEEGLYEWIQDNTIGGHFKHNNLKGILAVGGLSCQMVFKVAPDANVLASKETPLIDGVEYTVYTHSWLGLGRNEALTEFLHQQSLKGRVDETGTYCTFSRIQISRFETANKKE